MHMCQRRLIKISPLPWLFFISQHWCLFFRDISILQHWYLHFLTKWVQNTDFLFKNTKMTKMVQTFVSGRTLDRMRNLWTSRNYSPAEIKKKGLNPKNWCRTREEKKPWEIGKKKNCGYQIPPVYCLKKHKQCIIFTQCTEWIGHTWWGGCIRAPSNVAAWSPTAKRLGCRLGWSPPAWRTPCTAGHGKGVWTGGAKTRTTTIPGLKKSTHKHNVKRNHKICCQSYSLETPKWHWKFRNIIISKTCSQWGWKLKAKVRHWRKIYQINYQVGRFSTANLLFRVHVEEIHLFVCNKQNPRSECMNDTAM